ncbi:beta-lactamase-like protein [Coniochaeta sp. 2T2.1]|nr:beta-lactamase-like protein [Coniochaeta sp. 2T2.1]
MSTFNGLMAEFPDIRVDFFRSHPERRPPLACFLSHIHSDHLAGLESLRSPFLYCSAATKELLLQLERYPCRINYAKGIIEARVMTYRPLKDLLKPLPMETPVTLELEPGNHIQVTLFDANHCPGAVMFLFEGHGKAVLYTGDIRSEPWFVNAIARSPSLVEYSSGLKTLDTIYLDTSFIDDIAFQTKAEGIRELLQKVSRYPPDTIFHLQAWTYGYEDVWIALSKFLRTKIHVDKYKMKVYKSLVAKDASNKFGAQFHFSPEAPGLVGFMCGNTHHEGCLTLDETVRLHSCEKGNYCSTVQKGPVVRIQPIIAHLPDGQDLAEIGVGGGGDDLERDAELDFPSLGDIDTLLEVIGDMDNIPDELREAIRAFLLKAVQNGRNVALDLDISTFGEANDTVLGNAVHAIAKKSKLGRYQPKDIEVMDILPKTITFPYSRHASYPELCDLVSAFKPRDVWPCTVSPAEWVKDGTTIKGLFGAYCSGTAFQHDILMEPFMEAHQASQSQHDTQTTASSLEIPRQDGNEAEDELRPRSPNSPSPTVATERPHSPSPDAEDATASEDDIEDSEATPTGSRKRDYDEYKRLVGTENDSQTSEISERAVEVRMTAFQAMLGNVRSEAWQRIGLLSTDDNHTTEEEDLGLDHG